MRRNQRAYRRAAFTLIEILVVIAVIGFLSVVALVTLGSAKEKARIAGGKKLDAVLHRALGIGMAGEWALESIGSGAQDSSGNANNGTPTGPSVTLTSGCIENNCYTFTGVDYVTVAHANSLIATKDVSMTLWVKPALGYGIGANPGLLSKRRSWGGLWISAVAGTDFGKLWGRIRQSGDATLSSGVEFGKIKTIPLNKWSHIALTTNSSPSVKKIRLYVDGALIEEKGYDGTIRSINDDATANDNLLIGAQFHTFADVFGGAIDQVRYYPIGLSLAQIQQLYATTFHERGIADD